MTAVPVSATNPAGSSARTARNGWGASPAFFFGYDVIVILVLLATALVSSAHSPDWEGWRMEWPVLAFDKVVPLWVPWAGALGGATISLVGVAKYANRWDDGYRWWHVSRPILGAVTGTISVLVLVFVLQSIAPGVADQGYTLRGKAVLTGIAFIVGYREKTFRELVKRVADVILKPGDPKPTPPTDQQAPEALPTVRFGPDRVKH